MAQAYTPGLRVTRQTILRKSRVLPLKGEVLAKVGDTVKADDIVAKTELPGNVKIMNIIGLLGAEVDEVPSLMVKEEGDRIAEGDVIAQTKPILPFLKFLVTKIKSPIAGTVEKISSVTGQVILRENPLPVTIAAYINGKVVEIIPEEGVVVESPCSFIQGIFGVGGEINGELVMAVSKPSDDISPEDITSEYKDKIIVCGRYVGIDVFRKAKEVGVRGIITGGFGDKDLKELLGYDLGVAITGHEKLGVTLVVTEGFGYINMADKTFNLLKEREGRQASISGATQIRAGVIRPEIIVPLDEGMDAAEIIKKETGGVQIGDQVRIIRQPNFGRLAKVKQLIPELVVVESGTKVRVMEVEFEDGETFVVPRANIEIIEE
jgi:hypothetical protein